MKIKKKNIIAGLVVIIVAAAVVIFSLLFNSGRSGIQLKIEDNGIPLSHQRINTQNVQSAYDKLKNGIFSDAELQSSDWKNLEAKYEPEPDDNAEIIISSDLKIGQGVANSDEKTRELLQILPLEFIQKLSNHINDLADMIPFHAPGNKGLLYTDSQGHAVSDLPLGWTAIYHDNQFIKFANFSSKDESVNVDVSNTSDALSITLSDADSAQKGISTVEYGQVVKYQLKIKKEFLRTNLSIDINMPSNLYIDDISVPNKLVSDTESPIDTSDSQQPSDNLGQKMNTAVAVVDEKLNEVSLNHYHIDAAASDEDFTAEITAHIVSSNSITVPVTLGLGDGVRNITVEKKAFLPDKKSTTTEQQDLTKNFKILVTAQNELGQKVSAESTSLGSSGINFLIYNADKKTAAQGAEFILGKKQAGKTYAWSSNASWVETDDNLSKADLSAMRVITGGSRYILDDAKDLPLPTNGQKWTYGPKDEQISHSVIQLYGLGQDTDYFLYQVKAADDQTENHKEFDFQASRQLLPASGEKGATISTSLGKAVSQDYKSNMLLPGYKAGVNEYNLLPVSPGTIKSSSTTISVIIPIVLLSVVFLLLAILFIYFI
jgi:hypothetical protein